jgi:ATPase subunit of ABC transporter with duplicated ATPase domains
MLNLSAIGKSYGQHRVLANVSFSISAGERVGLVGPNGAGKTTLLKIAAGLIAPDAGSVRLDTGAKLAYLGQEISGANGAMSVSEFLCAREVSEVSTKMLGWCAKLGLSPDLLSHSMETLSGGEKSKIGLVRLLMSDADICLLDEPTNNLDLSGLAWLEKNISASRAAFVIVSHDRKFLDHLTTRTLELNEVTGNVCSYDGEFSAYLAERERRLEKQWEKFDDYRAEVRRLEKSAVEKKNWSDKGAEQEVKDNDKFVRGKARDYSAGNAALAKAIEKRLSRIEPVERPLERLPMKLAFDSEERGGDLVFSVSGLVVEIGGRTFGPLDFSVTNGERVAIIGPNGVGKSLLLKALVGEIVPVHGDVRRGSGLKIGYLSQEPLRLDSHSALSELGDVGEEGLLRRTLHRFRIDAKDVDKPVAQLSPGQRSRLVLAKLMLQRGNCLVLDEPSNHLDLEAMEAFEGALSKFEGAVIAVSHDRYFLDRFRPTRTLLMSDVWSVREISGYAQIESNL